MQAPPELVPRLQQLLRDGTYTKTEEGGQEGPLQKTDARILMVAETRTPVVVALEPLATIVKVLLQTTNGFPSVYVAERDAHLFLRCGGSIAVLLVFFPFSLFSNYHDLFATRAGMVFVIRLL